MLDDRVGQQLSDTQARLSADGTLASKAQIEAYYQAFRKRFGPDVLSSLDGETLLETMHNHSNHNSLVYWLEFKDDDEFPAIFGSIAGGSALKFGIYRRRETGAWTAGSTQKQQELSTQEAVQIARKHRDQFLRGVDLLDALPANGSDVDYARLQEAMNSQAPDVSDSSWGHKYFYLLYPDKLADFHNATYQRFHLITLLQLPPEGWGRYRVDGRYVAIARWLGWPINHLTTTLWNRHARPYRYWRIGTRLDGRHSRWNLMYGGNCVAVGWDRLGDLSAVVYDRESKEMIRQALQQHYPTAPQSIGRQTQQLFNFVAGIGEGDLVLPCDGERVLAIGRVTGGYSFQPGSDAPHRRPVGWLSTEEWRLPHTEGLQTTVTELKGYVENQIEIERRVLYAPAFVPPPPDPEPVIGPRPAVQLTGTPGRIQAILERKKQVILYGPPGTGKTYWARTTALDLAAYASFGLAFGSLTGDQPAAILGNQEKPGRVRMCTFHPAYGYEDFLEGYRPHAIAGQLLFERHDGVFKTLCDDARRQPDCRFYLIVDEINRGDIPRIFGELLTVLEKDKRSQPILLPLSGASFTVPDNVYVIGTMNTADRSIALLDTALRRRFGFVELMPDSSCLGDVVVGSAIPLGPWLDALNSRLMQSIGRDARNLQIGHAYLMEGGKPVTHLGRFARIVQDDILPLLEEYCYEDYATLVKILGPGLVDQARQQIRHELFAPARRDELVAALMAPCPEIATSLQAVTSALDESQAALGLEGEADAEGER